MYHHQWLNLKLQCHLLWWTSLRSLFCTSVDWTRSIGHRRTEDRSSHKRSPRTLTPKREAMSLSLIWRSPAARTAALLFSSISSLGVVFTPLSKRMVHLRLFRGHQSSPVWLQSGAAMPLSSQFKSHLPWFEVVNFGESQVAFGLSRNGHLYANTRQLVKNCTSFVLTPRHLIFTTNNHFVKYVHLVEDVDGKLHNSSFSSRLQADSLQSSMCLVMTLKSMSDAEVWSVGRVF
jgi:hypothetical protein